MRYILTRIYYLKKSLPLILALMLGLTGCSGENALFTDAGTDVTIQAQKEDYLDLSALEEDSADTQTFNGYKVHTLAYGDFQTESAAFSANPNVIETTVVRAEYSSGTMRLVQMMDLRYGFVKKGDVLALVSMETNELDLEELEIKLSRVKERYNEFKTEFEASHEEARKEISVYELPGKIDRIEFYQAELDFARQEQSYLKQIESYEEQIEELKGLMNMTQILAPTDGIVTEVNRESAGTKLENGDMIAKIIPADQMYMGFEDSLFHYAYGNDMTFIVGRNIQAKEFSAKVITTNGKALSSDWNRQISYIQASVQPYDVLTEGPFYVKAITNVMKNVLLIPFDAVTTENGKFFVTVLNEDGTLEKTQFLAGGNNTEYYWVYDGLAEGTSVLIYNN